MSEEKKMINLTIDGIPVTVEDGTTILKAAASAGIEIPTLCYLKDLAPDGACRVCVVEVVGAKKPLVTACSEPCMEGMEVLTDSDAARDSRKFVLDLLVSTHNKDCFSCAANGACKLQEYAFAYGVDDPEFDGNKPDWAPIDSSNPFFEYDPSKCILCRRCVRTCSKISGNGTISITNRGFGASVGTAFALPWNETICESCGNCVSNCPTGALSSKDNKHDYRAWTVDRVRTTCPHCGTGCQYDLLVDRKKNKIVGVEPADGAANHGRLCVKGKFGSYKFVNSGERLTKPLIKENGKFREAEWDEALDLVASKFTELKNKYGGQSLAGFACSRSANEDIYMLQKMVRTSFDSNNVDNCARVCHGPTVAGLAISFGSGAMTNTINDITANPEVIMLVGSNIEEAHPVIGMQLRKAVDEGSKLIVVDPRDINIAKKADIHLKLKPGTNVAFANGIMNVILSEGLADMDFVNSRTEGFEELEKVVREYTPERVAEICHINKEDLIRAAEMYAKAKTAPIIYCLGVTEHTTGTEGVMSMANMAMLVGKLGKPGCGVNPLRGQNNVQGACDMGATPADFPGYQKLANKEVFEKFEKAWGCKLPTTPGIRATECFPEMIKGNIKGLFIFGEDPVRTDADTHHVIKALESLDFLVVDDLFLTESAKYADVVLPGTAYAEKEGTFSNTERRVQRIRKAVNAPGEARLDTDIFTDIMNRMGYAQPHLTSAQIMDEIASLTPSFAGISHARLDSEELYNKGLQWPCTGPDHPGTPIMHTEKFTRGLGKLQGIEYRPSAELTDEEYPLILMTGRVLYQYNACAMTDKTPGLNEKSGHSFIEINSEDAAKLGIKNGDRVKVSSRRGEIESEAHVSGKTSPGETWMPFHFQDGNANWLTNAALDNIAAAPEYKVCAIKVQKA